MKTQTYCCPAKAQPGIKDDILGCGHTFKSSPDHEGFVDCPHCGIFFKAEQGKRGAGVATCVGGCGRSKDISDLIRLSGAIGFKGATWRCAECSKGH